MRPAAWFVLALLACNGEEPVDDSGDDTADTEDPNEYAVVRVTGGTFVEVGDTVTLTASTVEGTDAGYTWASSDPDAAPVDAEGVVTGLQAADVTITATGTTSGRSGSLQVSVRHEVPHQEEWAGSAHADLTAEAFHNWDDDGEVPASCARCHTTTGFRDYIGDDATAVDSVDGPHPIGQVVECEACHNATSATLSHVEFPSGVVVEDLGPEARCMTCHQGRSSKDDVDQKIIDAGATGEDTVDPDLGFSDIHYYAAAATLLAGVVRGGYQYDDQYYDVRFRHVLQRDTCHECHDPHTLILRLDACAGCHTGVSSYDDLKDIRMMASRPNDYDGDGDMEEGLYHEVVGLRTRLYAAIQTYATESATAASICYDAAYPNWFVDTDGDGTCDAAEVTSSNKYATWTPRLLKAAYNYQVGTRDPGMFAHNGKYIIELLYDSIADLNEATTADVDLSHTDRTDSGHFNGTAEAFRHWDEDEEVSTSCSKCHGGDEGFSFYVEHGVNLVVLDEPNGLECQTCHPDEWNYDPLDPQTVDVPKVQFGGGIYLDVSAFFAPDDAICATCHSGRQSKATIDAYLPTTTAPKFQNVHNLPGAATFYGSEAVVGYQYGANEYSGPWTHPPGASCSYCHSPGNTDHTFLVDDTFALCTACHLSASAPNEIRVTTYDFDGDGNTTETLPEELASFQSQLLVALDAYALAHNGNHICYDEGSWRIDVPTLGTICGDEDTTSYPANATTGWEAPMIKAAHNYQLSVKDPGSWAHNMDYIAQLLFDSIDDLDGTTGTLQRPPASP